MPFLILFMIASLVPGTATPGADNGHATPESSSTFAIHGFPPDLEPEMTALGTLGSVIALHPGESRVLVLERYDYERCGVGIQCFIPVGAAAARSVFPFRCWIRLPRRSRQLASTG